MVAPEDLRARTKRFAVCVVKLAEQLPRSEAAHVLGRQILRSGTSVAANYRALCRARSKAEFIAKMGTVIEEADETAFWLELLVETGIIPSSRVNDLLKEANELVSIF
jgi:four helix bundle protein